VQVFLPHCNSAFGYFISGFYYNVNLQIPVMESDDRDLKSLAMEEDEEFHEEKCVDRLER
jgi:hypothetical protein